MKIFGVTAVLAAAVIGGCREQVYRLDLKASDKGLERRLDWELDQTYGLALPPAGSPRSPQKIAEGYGAEPPEFGAVKAAFSGVFAERMPADVGGAGFYREFASSLGTTRVYLERFRGEPDLLAQIERQNEAVDAAVDVILGWLETRVKGEEGAERLLAWVGTDLRRDWKNLALYNWMAQEEIAAVESPGPASGEAAQQQFMRAYEGLMARSAHFLVERGYLTLAEAPALLAEAGNEGPESLDILPLLRRQVATRMGREELPAALLADFASSEALQSSLVAYLAGSDAMQRLLLTWAGKRQAAGAPIDDDGKEGSLFRAALMATIAIPLFRNYDDLAVRLQTGREPIATSGVWDSGTGTVSWSARLQVKPGEAAGRPLLAYAVWAEPAAAAQRELLGSEILGGWELAEYCVWRAGLTPDETEQWESALLGMRPGPDLKDRLRAFRFREREDEDSPVGGAAVILGRLNAGD